MVVLRVGESDVADAAVEEVAQVLQAALDRGPVLTYISMPLRGPLFDQQWEALSTRSVEEIKATEGEDFALFQRIREEERRREPYLLLETLKVLAKGQVRIDGGRVVDEKGRPLKGLCLNEAIEEAL